MDAVATLLAALRRPLPPAEPAPALTAPERLALPGGRAVLLRTITAADAEAEQDFVAHLSLDSRHKRFHIGLQRLSPGLLRQMIEVDQRDHVALVAEVLDGSGVLVADARYVRDPAQPDAAEFAIAVADDWQSLGLGRALMARLAARARRDGLRRLFGDVLHGNRRMQVLMQGLGATAHAHPDGPQLMRLVFELENSL
ncbi:GNAT family N-acetyltransferase [Roseateles violae]|uniref:GNAT family N-acetyltransferase n=1 Tax=Roseateles violae TaxID=3058042 RepID=A0ABT8DST3_9BURK|nr:GNAT family N-acetyltransferase [Pelomonas sp. PFR6]MDN3919969.1 GNAT family N-acetyltransferase [Pelomonas sp. PFR6]